MPSSRHRSLLTGAIAITAMLIVSSCAAGPSVPPTGEVTEVTVTVQGMNYVPDVIEVPVGDELVITFENTSLDVHDLVFANGVKSKHLAPGESEVLEVGVIGDDLDGWCAISNHRELGMTLVVRAV